MSRDSALTSAFCMIEYVIPAASKNRTNDIAFHEKLTHSGIELAKGLLPMDICQNNEPANALTLSCYPQSKPYNVAEQSPMDFRYAVQIIANSKT